MLLNWFVHEPFIDHTQCSLYIPAAVLNKIAVSY